MNELEKLLAIEEIRNLKARYFRCVDGKDWRGFEALFSPDAIFDISEDVPGCILRGPASIAAAASAPLAEAVSVHHGHCPEIEITSATTARGIWAMEDLIRWRADSSFALRSLHGYGHYHETYERVDGRWVIKTLKLARLRVDSVTRDASR